MIDRHPSADPVHPGEILREDILPALSISKTAVKDGACGRHRHGDKGTYASKRSALESAGVDVLPTPCMSAMH